METALVLGFVKKHENMRETRQDIMVRVRKEGSAQRVAGGFRVAAAKQVEAEKERSEDINRRSMWNAGGNSLL